MDAPPYLSERTIEQLKRAAEDAAPVETCGIIVNDNLVIELPNHAPDRTHAFHLQKADIVDAITYLVVESMAIWHTHPHGGVGPSRIDMRNKVEGVPHLVVTLVEDDILLTWY